LRCISKRCLNRLSRTRRCEAELRINEQVRYLSLTSVALLID